MLPDYIKSPISQSVFTKRKVWNHINFYVGLGENSEIIRC